MLTSTARCHPPSALSLVPQRFESSVAITKAVLGGGTKVNLLQAMEVLKACSEGLKIVVMGIRRVTAEHTLENSSYPVRRATVVSITDILAVTQQKVPSVALGTLAQDAIAAMGPVRSVSTTILRNLNLHHTVPDLLLPTPRKSLIGREMIQILIQTLSVHAL
ncbi:hypothetical protein HDU93_001276 [Gonapodya sp. JEL0774]|nr:hypothetical protein HDU93_001276 [Gonapodya sp. JEL0774]